jgi:hypothetical protein
VIIHRVPALAGALSVVALVACSGMPLPDSASSADEPVASMADPAGRMRGYQFNRKYQDRIKVDGRLVSRTIEYGFDYDAASTVRRSGTPDSPEFTEERLPNVTLRANAAESARMIELVRTHPRLGPLMKQDGLHIHAGGFVLRESGDRYCDVGSRCVRVIVSSGDGSIPVLHAVVDLVSDRVVYPDYQSSIDQHSAAKGKTQ